jgi:hypothetical protein
MSSFTFFANSLRLDEGLFLRKVDINYPISFNLLR